jgi:large subunit ribosomal protein L17
MRHQKLRGKLGLGSSHRKAMLQNMTTSLLQHERIETTITRAKEVRKMVDQVLTLAKRESLHARRQVLSIIPDKSIVKKLFGPLASRYSSRSSGFTRIYRIGERKGDAAPMAVIELIDAEVTESPKKSKEKAPDKKA